VNDSDLTRIRARVPAYAGLGDPGARRASDQHLRAWSGEILAGLRERVPAGAVRERLDAIVLRCEFGDQRLVMAFEEHGALADGEALARYLAADRATVEAVDAAVGTAEPEALARALEAVEGALNERLRTAGVDAG
jgi:hypothetical protein